MKGFCSSFKKDPMGVYVHLIGSSSTLLVPKLAAYAAL